MLRESKINLHVRYFDQNTRHTLCIKIVVKLQMFNTQIRERWLEGGTLQLVDYSIVSRTIKKCW